MMLDILKGLISPIWSAVVGMRRVVVRVHLAVFARSGTEAYFINVVNLSEKRDVEITHIWFDSFPQIPVLRDERPLPKRLKPDEVWETWIETSQLPSQAKDAYSRFRVRLSTGRVLKSVRNRNVPPVGMIPGAHNKS